MYKSNNYEQLFKHEISDQVILLLIVGEDVYDFLGYHAVYEELIYRGWFCIDESDYLGLPDNY